jgi:hypothetical protein
MEFSDRHYLATGTRWGSKWTYLYEAEYRRLWGELDFEAEKL